MNSFKMPLSLLILTSLLCKHAEAGKPRFTDTGVQVSTLNEYQSTGKKLADVECEDVDNDDTKISIQSVSPSNGPCSQCFSVVPGATSTTYSLEFLVQGDLDYKTTPTYYVTLTCVDDNGEVAQENYVMEIRVIPNTPPYLPTNLNGDLQNVKTVKAGDVVYDVQCSDANNDPLTFTLKALSYEDYFYIDQNGKIRAARDLSTLCADVVNFEVTCKDPHNPTVGPVRKQIALSGANEPPIISGLNRVVEVAEDTRVGDTVISFSVDDDNNDPRNCYLSAVPSTSLSLFKISGISSGVGQNRASIDVKSPLDYETQAHTSNLSLTCTDTYCTSQPAYVTVLLTDVNDPIQIQPSRFSITTDEGMIDIPRSYTVADQDATDTVSYRIGSDSSGGSFVIDTTSGDISTSQVYDVDSPANKPSLVTIEIEARDSKGTVATATMTLTVNDVNDNKPSFAGSQLSFRDVSRCTAIGSSVGDVTATDNDSAFQGNNLITYSGSSGPFSVLADGSIIVNSALSAGVYTIPVTAADSGQNPGTLSSDPTDVSVVVVEACPAGVTPAPTATTPTTTTTAATPPPANPATTTTAAVSTGTGNNDTPIGNGNGLVDLTSSNAAGDFFEHNFEWIVTVASLGGVFLLAVGAVGVKVCCRAGSAAATRRKRGDKNHARRSPGAVQPEDQRHARARQPHKRMGDTYETQIVSPSTISYIDEPRLPDQPPKRIQVYDPWKGRGLPY